MSPDDPRHGRPSGYRAGCRCDTCGTSWRRKNKSWEARSYANGGATTEDGAPLASIIIELHQHMSLHAIAEAVGTTQSYIGRVMRGHIKRVGNDRAQAIRQLASSRPVPDSGAFVSAAATTRRLRALTALGYSTYRLAEALDASRTTISDLLNGNVPQIHGSTHHRAAEMYARLSMVLPAAANRHEQSGITRARLRAERQGWLPPLAWDDIDQDDESNVVEKYDKADFILDEIAVQRVIDGDGKLARHLSPEERAEVVRRWAGTLNELERLTGWNVAREKRRAA